MLRALLIHTVYHEYQLEGNSENAQHDPSTESSPYNLTLKAWMNIFKNQQID